MERSIKKVIFETVPSINVKKVAAYARVSTAKDAMQHSLSAQVSYYSTLIQKHPGWLYCGVYSDDAQTGTKVDRKDFQRMLADCRSGALDMIITKSISRFARNTVTLLESVRELKILGVDVFFEEQNIHTMSADGELMLTILASYAQEESRSASENQKWRIKKGFERGELLNWRFMYGYNITRDGIKINEEEADIVREVFRRFLDGETLDSIARYLNNSGHTGRFGGKRKATRIREMLSNEKYLGNALLMKRYCNNHLEKRQIRNRGELPMYYAEGTHDAIIDEDTFNRAQERLKELDEVCKNWKRAQRYAFSGLITCAQCGGKYRRIKNHNYHAWNCNTYHIKGKRACPGLQIREDVLCQVAAEALGLSVFDEHEFLDRVTGITADGNHTLTFSFKDGDSKKIHWQTPSRRSSWTPEMREAARQRALQNRKGEYHGRKDTQSN